MIGERDPRRRSADCDCCHHPEAVVVDEDRDRTAEAIADPDFRAARRDRDALRETANRRVVNN